MALHATQIIIKPLVTEKSTWEGSVRNRYAFEVHPDADKKQIRSAIEALFGVRVTGVATQTKPGKYRRTRWGTHKTRSWKKAVVAVHEDDRIDLY